jgi:hypothetical protein
MVRFAGMLTVTHHDLNIQCKSVTREQIQAADRLKDSAGLGKTQIKLAEIIGVGVPLVIPVVRLHLKVRRFRNNKVNGVI